MALSVNFYTQWYWKIDVHNLLHFVQLRSDETAQYEIRVYANTILKIVQKWMPLTAEAFLDYNINAFNLSGPAIEVVRALLTGAEVKQGDSRLSSSEWRELMDMLYPQKRADNRTGKA
jgi:thymidylate synthase (FAD)